MYIYLLIGMTELIGMAKPIKDDHTRKDDFTPVTRSGDGHVADDYETAIQYLQ